MRFTGVVNAAMNWQSQLCDKERELKGEEVEENHTSSQIYDDFPVQQFLWCWLIKKWHTIEHRIDIRLSSSFE